MVLFSNQFKSSKWAPVFTLSLKYWYLSKMIPFLKCPLVPTFLLLIKAKKQKKQKSFLSRNHSLWSFFVIFFPHSCPHLILISGKKTEGHMLNCIIIYFIFYLLNFLVFNPPVNFLYFLSN